MSLKIPHRYLKFIFWLSISVCLSAEAYSQSVFTGSIQEEQLKLHMLLADSLTVPPVNRPWTYSAYDRFIPSETHSRKWWERSMTSASFTHDLGGYTIRGGFYPFHFQNTLNTRLPHGDNNGAAWYGRGNNSEFRAGFYFTSDYLSVSFYPHIIYQENKDFLTPEFIPGDGKGGLRYIAEGIGVRYDAPFRFGPDPFTTFDWGNSYIRAHYKSIEAGLSTEPLWWGPMQRYPLIMSNNAPGVPHAFLGTREPLDIPYIGDLQFKWMAGYPRESGYYDGVGAGNVNFMNNINIAYRPSFLKNMTLGYTRVYHFYQNDGFDFNDLLVIFDPLRRRKLVSQQGEDHERQDRNQLASVYVHFLLPEANAEIFGEFFREDHSYDLRDLFVQINHNSAYAFGFQKISHPPYFDFIKTHLEFTNLTTSQLKQVRPQTMFYTHSRIRQGHTNRGQILGAAIGPGSNSQFLALDAYKDEYKFGLFAHRLVDNDNFHFEKGSSSLSPSRDFGDYFRHRVDLTLGINFIYSPGPFLINGKIAWTKAYNYGRFDYGKFEGVTIQNYERKDRSNVHFQIGVTYIL